MKQIEWLESVNFDAGWVDDPANVADAVSGFNYATFNDTPAGRVSLGELPKQVALWKDIERFTGKPTLPVMNQGNAGFCVMSKAGVNWTDMNVLSKAGINWSDMNVLTRAAVNWDGLKALSQGGVNWSDFQVMSRAGVNWTDLQALSKAGVNWSDFNIS